MLHLYYQRYATGPWKRVQVRSKSQRQLIAWCKTQVAEVLPLADIRGTYAICHNGTFDVISSPSLDGIDWVWKQDLKALHPDFHRGMHNGKRTWIYEPKNQLALFPKDGCE